MEEPAAPVAALLEDIRRNQEQLRRELLSGQASILSELRSLRQAWQARQSGSGQNAAAAHARGSLSFESLSRGLEDITDSVTKNIEGLTAVFRETKTGEASSSAAAGPGAALPTPSALSGARGSRRRESLGHQAVRFSDQRVSLHRGSASSMVSAAAAADEEDQHEEERRLSGSSSDAAAFMVGSVFERSGDPRKASEAPAKRLSSTVDSAEPLGAEGASSASSEQVKAFVDTAPASTARASRDSEVQDEAPQGSASGSAHNTATEALMPRDEGF
eukprot:TRINITY_DN6278_c0_g1_i2.p2 TRINITY_DN6278_c0_g1~~TRINITY_DN6278_c0_g1_i2.p2  ORF type:complete len:285 (-),score=75.79 TRINITY_DN6278_c0_g1_i2:26-850(-)